MEMLELSAANQTAVNTNGTFGHVSAQQSQQAVQQHIPVGQMNLGPAHIYRNHHQQQQQQQHNLRYVSFNQKVSQHRELPVDVPDSFVGIAKQSPRYPPPKSHRQASPINNLTTFNHAPTNLPFNQNNPTNCAQPQQQVAPPIVQNTAANIITHNSSLRSSIKLKQLEKSRGGHGQYPVGQMRPAVNQAFELNEDDGVSSTNQMSNNNQANISQQPLKSRQSTPDLSSIYNRLQLNLNGDLSEATGGSKLVKLISIYNTIVETHSKQFRIPNLTSTTTKRVNSQGIQEPVTYKVSDLLQSVIYSLRSEAMTSDAVELLEILCKHEIDGVCSAFDRIAQSFEYAKPSQPVHAAQSTTNGIQQAQPQYQQKQQQMNPYQPHQIDDYDYANDQVQMDIENNLLQNQPLTTIDLGESTCTKQVRIEKNANQPLGATIKNEDGGVVIGRIVCGGAAYNSRLLSEGDEIIEVNGIEMRGKNINEVISILEGMNGLLTFTIISRGYKPYIQRPPNEKILVRAFFKYDGGNDRYIPCKELGLTFERGEILAIIDQSDPKWWQAHRESDSEYGLAGLIPSINFLKEREKESTNEDFADACLRREKKNLVSLLFNCPKGNSPRRRKKLANIPFGPEEIPYYEEVCTYYPSKQRKRPIILVGPKMIGQREIVSKLLQDPTRFASAISHTSKPMEPHERDGVDFHFVSRAQFERDIKAGKFIECGQYQNQYYGTSLEAMLEVVKSKKVSTFERTTILLDFRYIYHVN